MPSGPSLSMVGQVMVAGDASTSMPSLQCASAPIDFLVCTATRECPTLNSDFAHSRDLTRGDTGLISFLSEAKMFHRSKHPYIATTGFLALSALSTIALGHTYERCDADGDHCVRVTCDHDGDKCWSQSEHSRKAIYVHPGRWVCDSDGDRCHYEYTGGKWNPHWEHRDGDRDR